MDDLAVLIEIQESILACRRAAANLPPELAQELFDLADELETLVREIDAGL